MRCVELDGGEHERHCALGWLPTTGGRDHRITQSTRTPAHHTPGPASNEDGPRGTTRRTSRVAPRERRRGSGRRLPAHASGPSVPAVTLVGEQVRQRGALTGLTGGRVVDGDVPRRLLLGRGLGMRRELSPVLGEVAADRFGIELADGPLDSGPDRSIAAMSAAGPVSLPLPDASCPAEGVLPGRWRGEVVAGDDVGQPVGLGHLQPGPRRELRELCGVGWAGLVQVCDLPEEGFVESRW